MSQPLALRVELPHTQPMKTLSLACAVIACLGSVALADKPPATDSLQIGEHVPLFTAEITTVSGAKPKTSKFDSGKSKHITAYVFVGSTCPATNAYVDRFKDLERVYG